MTKHKGMMPQTIIKTLTKIREYADNNNNPSWIISQKTGEYLNNLIRTHDLSVILEIGTSVGYSGIWMAEALQEKRGGLITVESNKARFERAKTHFEESGLTDTITQFMGHAPEDLNLETLLGGKKIDLLFLDAIKHYYLPTLQVCMPYLNDNAYIVADNALSHEEELSEYKDFVFNHPQLKSELKQIGTGIFVSYFSKTT